MRTTTHILRRLSFFLGLGFLVLPDACGILKAQSPNAKQLAAYQEQHRELAKAYYSRLGQIAEIAQKAGFAEDAKAIKELAIPFDPSHIQSDNLPRKILPKLPPALPAAETWRLELRRLREDYAAEMYRLSRLSLNAKFPSAAYRFVREAAAANPDHKEARRVLGFQRFEGEWITPFEAEQERKRMVWHDKFGWLRKTYVDRYNQGERYYGGWMPAEKENEHRRDFKNAWEIPTEHFLVKTNHSLERGVEIAKKLEEYHDFFVKTFPGYFHTPDQLQKLFNSASTSMSRRRGKPFIVHYYRTREEYNQTLVKDIPQIAFTTGLYHNGHRVAYFYHDPKENDESPLYHEATHQILCETRFTSPRNLRIIGEESNFWIIEGIACYMESVKGKGGKFTLGDPAFKRFYWARHRFLQEKYFVGLAQFASMGMREFQNQPQESLRKNYSQASGLAHFFMHYDHGAYRDALVEHLSQIYNPYRNFQQPASLAELTGVPFKKLDEQYQQYLRDQETALNRRRFAPGGR